MRNLKAMGKVFIEGREEGKKMGMFLLLQLRELVRSINFTRR